MPIDGIVPASKQETGVYMPYYQAANKRNALPYAIGLYKSGSLEGERNIEGGENISFVAIWNVCMLPADLTRCRLKFDGDEELSYEIGMPAHEFVDFLFEVLAALNLKRTPDFSKTFYRRLLRVDE